MSHHPSVAGVLKFFVYDHLPEDQKRVSQPFCDLAHYMSEELPDCAEKTVALRKLMEAKDAAVRASLDQSPQIQENFYRLTQK